MFDTVVVDEAGQATEPESMLGLIRCSQYGRIILIGDHMQLPPYVESTDASFLFGYESFREID